MSRRRRQGPVDGPIFRAVIRLKPGGKKRLRALALVAAHHDGGAASVGVQELAERLNLPPRTVNELLRRLHADGYLERTTNRRPRYRVADAHLPGEREALTTSGGQA